MLGLNRRFLRFAYRVKQVQHLHISLLSEFFNHAYSLRCLKKIFLDCLSFDNVLKLFKLLRDARLGLLLEIDGLQNPFFKSEISLFDTFVC